MTKKSCDDAEIELPADSAALAVLWSRANFLLARLVVRKLERIVENDPADKTGDERARALAEEAAEIRAVAGLTMTAKRAAALEEKCRPKQSEAERALAAEDARRARRVKELRELEEVERRSRAKYLAKIAAKADQGDPLAAGPASRDGDGGRDELPEGLKREEAGKDAPVAAIGPPHFNGGTAGSGAEGR